MIHERNGQEKRSTLGEKSPSIDALRSIAIPRGNDDRRGTRPVALPTGLFHTNKQTSLSARYNNLLGRTLSAQEDVLVTLFVRC